MSFNRIVEFNSKKLVTNIIPPMTQNGPICDRKYTIYYSPVTCEHFLTIGNYYCNENLNTLLSNEAYAKWDNECGISKLKFYVKLNDENPLILMARYALYKELIPNYIRTIIHGDKYLFKENKCLLNTPITVRFISKCEKFNMVEPYGTLKYYK